MRDFIEKLKPSNGFSNVLHLFLVILVPLLVLILVRINFFQLALAIILLSKWRMFAVKPRYWPANIRANGVDIIIGVSIVFFMIHTNSLLWQLVWTALYVTWLTVIKPMATVLGVSSQAMLAQLLTNGYILRMAVRTSLRPSCGQWIGLLYLRQTLF